MFAVKAYFSDEIPNSANAFRTLLLQRNCLLKIVVYQENKYLDLYKDVSPTGTLKPGWDGRNDFRNKFD